MSTITDLIQQVGQAKAQAIAARGQIYGGVVKGLGDLATDSYQRRIQQQQLARQNAAQDQSLALAQNQDTRAQNQDTREQAGAEAQQGAAVRAEAGRRLLSILKAPEEQKAAMWTAFVPFAVGNKLHTPQEIPAQYPGDAMVKAELYGTAPDQMRADTEEQRKADELTLQRSTQDRLVTQAQAAAQNLTADNTRADAAGAETIRHNKAMEARPVGGATSADPQDAAAIADAIISGDQPPVTTGLFRLAGPVRAALAKKGYNLATANLDWTATQKHISTLNGAQQTRMAQAVDNAAHSLDVIDGLADQWKGSNFPILNKANLALAKSGAKGPQAQQIATQLEAQISDVTSELGNVYMGGNSPTDHALQLAGKNLSADWSEATLRSMTKLARTNLQIRMNSMRNIGPAGTTAGNPYAPQQGAPAAPAAAPQVIRYDMNGKALP